jgi:HEAT repeat protein
MARDPDKVVRGKALAALTKMQPFDGAVVELVGSMLNDPDKFLADRVVNVLLERADENGDVARQLVEALRNPKTRMKARGSARNSRTLYQYLEPLLGDPDPKLRAIGADFITMGFEKSAKYAGQLRLLARDDPDATVKQAAERALGYLRTVCRMNGRMGVDEQVQAEAARLIVKDLAEEMVDAKASAEARARAAGLVVQYLPAGAEATAALTAALKDPEPRVRQAAASTLGKIGKGAGPEAAKALAAAMKDDDAQVRAAAQRALSAGVGQADSRAAASLVADKDASVRLRALDALDAKASVDVLRKAVEDPDAAVRAHAVQLLGRNAVGIDAVLRARGDSDPEVQQAAHDAVDGLIYPQRHALVGPVIDLLGTTDDFVRTEAALLISRDGEHLRQMKKFPGIDEAMKKSASVLLTAAKAEKDSAKGARFALAMLTLSDAGSAALAELAKDPSPALRLVAVGALPVKLCADLLGDSDRAVRAAAADRLVRDPQQGLGFLLMALSDSRPVARAQAAAVLYQVDFSSVEVGPQLKPVTDALTAALKDRDAVVRSGAATALANLSIVETVPAMAALAADPDATVRTCVARAMVLPAMENPQAFDVLVKLTQDADAHVRGSAVAGLGRGWRWYASDAQIVRIVGALTASLQDSDRSVRSYALGSLRELGAGAAGARPALEKYRDQRRAEPGITQMVDATLKVMDDDAKTVDAALTQATPMLAKDVHAASRVLQSSRVPVRKVAPLLDPMLKADDVNSVTGAINVLNAMQQPSQLARHTAWPTQAQIDGLRAADAATRAKSVEEVGRLGPAVRNMTASMIALLKDADPSVRAATRQALRRIWAGTYLAL